MTVFVVRHVPFASHRTYLPVGPSFSSVYNEKRESSVFITTKVFRRGIKVSHVLTEGDETL